MIKFILKSFEIILIPFIAIFAFCSLGIVHVGNAIKNRLIFQQWCKKSSDRFVDYPERDCLGLNVGYFNATGDAILIFSIGGAVSFCIENNTSKKHVRAAMIKAIGLYPSFYPLIAKPTEEMTQLHKLLWVV